MKLEIEITEDEIRSAVEPERDDLPITIFVVLDEMGIPVFCAAYPQACSDHISDAIVEHEIHSAGLWVVREYTLDPRTRSQKLADAGFTRRPSLRAMDMREALELIAAPMRPDGTWNRDRTACQQLAAEALGRYDDDQKTPKTHLYKSHGDHRRAGQTRREYAHSTACGYVRDKVTNEPEAVTCKHCLAAMRKAVGA